MYKKFFKRPLDILLSGAGITALMPFFLLFTPIVALVMRGNPFFLQQRPGKDGKIFKIIKYRTMTNARDKDGKLLPDEDRLTKLGNFLRKTSVDELPELFNVFFGTMSLVGPRPQLIKDLVFFGDGIMRRQKVRPGVTGLAQTSGRNSISWEEKFQYDLEYVERITFFKDIAILIKTFFKVIRRSDISTEGMATAEDYGDYLLRTGRITSEEYAARIKEIK